MIAPAPGKRRARFILPGLYLALALYFWIDYANAPPDGLSNVGLFLVTLPVTLVGFLIDAVLGNEGFSLLPDSPYGYMADHAIYYVPAVAVTALLVWWIGRAIDRRPA